MRLYENQKNDLKEIFNKNGMDYAKYSNTYWESYNLNTWKEFYRLYDRYAYGSIKIGHRSHKDLVFKSRPERKSLQHSGKTILYYEANATCENDERYSVYWTKINLEAENEADACDWETYYVAYDLLDCHYDFIKELLRTSET